MKLITHFTVIDVTFRQCQVWLYGFTQSMERRYQLSAKKESDHLTLVLVNTTFTEKVLDHRFQIKCNTTQMIRFTGSPTSKETV